MIFGLVAYWEALGYGLVLGNLSFILIHFVSLFSLFFYFTVQLFKFCVSVIIIAYLVYLS